MKLKHYQEIPASESPEPDGFTGKLFQTFKEELIPVILKIFQKIQEEGRPPSHYTSPALS